MKNIEIGENTISFEKNGIKRTLDTGQYDGSVTEENAEQVIEELMNE